MDGKLQLISLLLLLAHSQFTSASDPIIEIECPMVNNKVVCQMAGAGFSYYDGCNDIVCGNNGIAMTTYKICSQPSVDEDYKNCRDLESGIFNKILMTVACPNLATPDDVCVTAYEGFSFTDGCNWHRCTADGAAISTRKYCQEPETRQARRVCNTLIKSIINQLPRRTCPMNTTEICLRRGKGYHFSDGCNGITCGDDSNAATTLMMCDAASAKSAYCKDIIATVEGSGARSQEQQMYTCPKLSASRVCTDSNNGFSYYDGCNTATCTGSGKASTTLIYCPTPSEKNKKAQEYCTEKEKEMKTKRSNSKNHTGACVTADEKCLTKDSKTSYFNGCNYCSCYDKGKAGCTRMGCIGFYGTDAEFTEYCKQFK